MKRSDPISCNECNNGRSYLLAGHEVSADGAPFAKSQGVQYRRESILEVTLVNDSFLKLCEHIRNLFIVTKQSVRSSNITDKLER